MARTSIIIPARNEAFLVPTINDVFHNARGEVEVVAILEAYTPDGWKELQAKHVNLHTIYHNEPRGMRPSITEGVRSAQSRGAKYIFKLDAHCSLGEGFDEILKADCEPNWVVVPRRKRLDPVRWELTSTEKPDIDYHYLSFPNDPADFGGPGLNGKVWEARARERRDKPEFDIDSEMSSQGSAWFMHAAYFDQLELMDAESYGTFWNEFQEIGMKCWLSGGQVKVNKKTWYAHWHKGKAGRGYRLTESLLKQGRNHTMKWLHNEAWAKQTLPFKTLIERFWPVPTWPENWEELVYGLKGHTAVGVSGDSVVSDGDVPDVGNSMSVLSLKIHLAHYGLNDVDYIDVEERLKGLIANNSLDIIVDNSTLTPGDNPFRGKKKTLTVTYSYDGNEPITVKREEKEWLIIGQAAKYVKQAQPEIQLPTVEAVKSEGDVVTVRPLSATALTDHLIRKFKIPAQRLRGPMPIELRDFHRDDLAKLFAELGFTKGAEIGVAEGHYSEVLLKANPKLELTLVDPWHAYSSNPQNKSKEKNEYAYNETVRKTKGYLNVKLDMRLSMDAVRDVPDGSLDFVYLDAHHSYPFIMSDLIFWSQKVRSGGIVSGDDVYQLNEKWGAGPMEAIYDYTRAMRINPWFLINAHKSVDFFFVNP